MYFVNNTADCGGAVYLKSILMNVGCKVSMNFCENKARNWHQVSTKYYTFRGAVLLHKYNSFISTGANTNLPFNSNFAGGGGGAIYLWYQSEIRLSSNNVVIFTAKLIITKIFLTQCHTARLKMIYLLYYSTDNFITLLLTSYKCIITNECLHTYTCTQGHRKETLH